MLSQTHSPTHSLTTLLTHSLTHSLPPSLPHSLTHSLPHSLTPSLPHSLTPSLPPSLTPSLTHSLTHSLTRVTLHTFTSDRHLHVVFLICHDLFYDHLFCAESRARSSNPAFINENFIIWIRKFEIYGLKQAIEQVIHVLQQTKTEA